VISWRTLDRQCRDHSPPNQGPTGSEPTPCDSNQALLQIPAHVGPPVSCGPGASRARIAASATAASGRDRRPGRADPTTPCVASQPATKRRASGDGRARNAEVIGSALRRMPGRATRVSVAVRPPGSTSVCKPWSDSEVTLARHDTGAHVMTRTTLDNRCVQRPSVPSSPAQPARVHACSAPGASLVTRMFPERDLARACGRRSLRRGLRRIAARKGIG